MCPSDSTVDHSITFLRAANRNERSFQPWNIIAYPIVSLKCNLGITNMHYVVAFDNFNTIPNEYAVFLIPAVCNICIDNDKRKKAM